MDKKENEVTIRINGEKKPYMEKKELPIEVEQDEAATVESADESFDWILPNEITPSHVPKKIKMQQKQNHQFRLKTPIILAIAAVVFGTSFGLIVIRTITSEQTVSKPIEQDIPTVAPITEATSKNMTVQTFLVQGGVFSTKESAQVVQVLIREKNLPAEVFQIENSYYLFLGAAENLEAAKQLALIYKTHDIDVFWKEVEFTTKLAKGDKEIEKILSVYKSLAELSAAKLQNVDSSVDINQIIERLNEVKSSEYKQVLTEAAKLLQNDKPSDAQVKLLTFLQNIAQ